MRSIILITLLGIIMAAKPAEPLHTLHFENANTDSVAIQPFKYKHAIIVYAMEPACTGCKDNLATLLKKYSKRQCPVYVVGNSNLPIENRKQAEIFLKNKFPYAKQALFIPESGIAVHMKTIDSTLKGGWHKTPYIIAYNSGSNIPKYFDYEAIFEGMTIKSSFITELSEFVGKSK